MAITRPQRSGECRRAPTTEHGGVDAGTKKEEVVAKKGGEKEGGPHEKHNSSLQPFFPRAPRRRPLTRSRTVLPTVGCYETAARAPDRLIS